MVNDQDSEEKQNLQRELESKGKDLEIYKKEVKSEEDTINTLQNKISKKEKEIEQLRWYQGMAFYDFFWV